MLRICVQVRVRACLCLPHQLVANNSKFKRNGQLSDGERVRAARKSHLFIHFNSISWRIHHVIGSIAGIRFHKSSLIKAKFCHLIMSLRGIR